MKFKTKSIGLILVIILSIGLLLACSKEEPQDNEVIKEDLSLNVGFLESKSQEDDKNYITIAINEDSLKLEVEDQGIYDSLSEDEFYMFSYNDDDVLKDIQTESYLKAIIEESMKEGIEDPEEDKVEEDDKEEEDVDKEDNTDNKLVGEVKPSSLVSIDGVTLLDEYIFDFNEDGYQEIIAMYVAADRDDDNQIIWDDGQRWLFVVHGDNKDYVLFDDHVQLGTVEFNVFTEGGKFYINTISARTASLTVSQFEYDSARDVFLKTIPLDVSGNVNMLHISSGY